MLVRIAPDERFLRDGDDLVTVLDVPAPLAALGTKLAVPSLDGDVEVEVSAGTQPGDVFTVRGHGMPRLRRTGRRGDLRVVANVVIPRRLSREQRKLLEQLADTITDENVRTDESLVGKLKRIIGCGAVIRLALRVRRADAELVLAELLTLVPAGVEERELGDVVEYAVYGAPGELPALPALRAAAGGALVDVATSEVADDWADRWRAFHEPVTVGGRLHVRPPWAPPAARRPEGHRHRPRAGVRHRRARHHPAVSRVAARARARATGHTAGVQILHPSTRTAAPCSTSAAGRACWPSPPPGSGSRRCARLDHDVLAVQATRANAAVNGVAVEVARHDLLHDGPPPAAPVVLANLLGPLLRHLATAGFAGGVRPEALIAGGLLVTEADELAVAFARRGLDERARRTEGEWAALLLAAPPTRDGPIG